MKRIPRKKKKLIPENTYYCYTPTSKVIKEKGRLSYYHFKPCKFYNHVEGIRGFCSLLKDEIIDKVKECGERERKKY